MNRAYVRLGKYEDTFLLAPMIREQDKEELLAADNKQPLEALQAPFSIKGSITYSIVEDTDNNQEEILGMFGTVPTPVKKYGVIWLLSSDRLRKYAKRFIQENEKWIKKISKTYQTVFNYVDCRNTVSQKWLEHLGFKNIETRPYGHLNLNFSLYIKEIPHV
tara:strand:+ start:186 stop:671 length:486 start_codon:yes stop_codon:yes gene_type:complete